MLERELGAIIAEDRKMKKPRLKFARVQDRIIKAIAVDYPLKLHDRDSLLSSNTLKLALKADQKNKNSGPKSIKKGLFRVKSEAVREVLVLEQDHPRVRLPEMGMVAISVSIASLNGEHKKWLKNNRGPEPTQEVILRRIITSARRWIDEELRLSNSAGLPLLILDASIIHGSSSFDMLITVLYRELAHFTRFVREVVQRTDHVNSSQTLQIPFRIGFPKLGVRSVPSITSSRRRARASNNVTTGTATS
jgi:hypothetical protein